MMMTFIIVIIIITKLALGNI